MLFIMMTFIASSTMYGSSKKDKSFEKQAPKAEMQYHHKNRHGNNYQGYRNGHYKHYKHRGHKSYVAMMPVKGCHCHHCQHLRKKLRIAAMQNRHNHSGYAYPTSLHYRY